MGIQINTGMVAKASEETRRVVEVAVGRANASLSACEQASDANQGFQTSAALGECVEAWATIIGNLVNKTVEMSDDLSATAQIVDYTEDQNRKAAAALKGML